MKQAALFATLLLALAACGERTKILPGEREALRPALQETQVVTDDAPAVTLSTAQNITAWPTRAGGPTNTMPHAALASDTPVQVWQTSIGVGNKRRHRIVADPVAADGRIFAMDSVGAVTAVAADGSVLWRKDMVPAFEKPGEASAGGLGLHNGVLYASTGFGNLHALDPATGAEQWVQRLDAPITAPAFVGNTGYLVSRDNRAWAMDLTNGRVLWDLPASPASAVMATAPAPVVTDRVVVFPFGSGELVAALRTSGIRVWGGAIAGSRKGVAYNALSDISADPVVAGNTLYAGTAAGRFVSMNAFSGQRNWTLNEGAVSPALPVGASVYFVSDRNELIRVDAATGDIIWAKPLPFFQRERVTRRKGIFAHFGPILANGRLWLASSDDVLRAFDPTTGEEVYATPLRGGAATRPIVMDGTLYVVSANGTLTAYR